MAPSIFDIEAKIPVIRVSSEDDPIIQSDRLEQSSPKAAERPRQNGINKSKNHNKSNKNSLNGGPKLDLPRPSFRKVPRDRYMIRKNTAKAYYAKKRAENNSPDCYFHYVEPTSQELDERIEYDMDLEDINWLEGFNEQFGDKNDYHLSDNEFERIMDRLEKKSYFSNRGDSKEMEPIDETAVCDVCGIGDCNNANVILFCDMCDLPVHQECYGVPYIPIGQWFCKRCQLSPVQNPECCLCPNFGGAFKQAEIPDITTCKDGNSDKKKQVVKIKKGWAHVLCALWIPDVSFANLVFLEPIEGIDKIEPARWKLKCYICNQKNKGACIQCSKTNCYTSFHATCAQKAGLYMRISPLHYQEDDGKMVMDVHRKAYCDKHTPSGKKCRGGGMYSGDESDEDVDSERYRKKDMVRKKNIQKTREKLVKETKEYKKEAAIVKVDETTLQEISLSLQKKGKRSHSKSDADKWNAVRMECVRTIHAYWLLKRQARNGVPLIRRLQLNNARKFNLEIDRNSTDAEKYTSLRYDLEKARLILGMLKKRERMKMQAYKKGVEIIRCKMDIYDLEMKTS